MNKIVGTIVAVASLMLLNSCDSELVRNKVREGFVTTCMESMGSVDAAKGKAYCECSADNMIKGKSLDEITKLEKDIESGTISQTDIETMLKPCIDELSKSLLEDKSTGE